MTEEVSELIIGEEGAKLVPLLSETEKSEEVIIPAEEEIKEKTSPVQDKIVIRKVLKEEDRKPKYEYVPTKEELDKIIIPKKENIEEQPKELVKEQPKEVVQEQPKDIPKEENAIVYEPTKGEDKPPEQEIKPLNWWHILGGSIMTASGIVILNAK